MRRCRAALEGGSEGIKAEAVVLPDGEQHKSTEVLMQVSALALWPRISSLLLVLSVGLGTVLHMYALAQLRSQLGHDLGQHRRRAGYMAAIYESAGAACRGLQAAWIFRSPCML